MRAKLLTVTVTGAVLAASLVGAAANQALASGGLTSTPSTPMTASAQAVASSAAIKVHERFALPQGGSVALTGHGWGHGHGMSQWGAAGAASEGLSASKILAFYYPGTKSTDIANPVVKVGLASQNNANPHNVHVKASGSIVFYNEANQKHYTYSSTSVWRVIRSNSRFLVQVSSGGSWVTERDLAGPIHIDTAAPTNHVTYPVDRTYTGWFRLVPTTSSHFMVVANVSMQNYLRGVVPSESISSWPAAALQAQAVAARTYAAYHYAHPRSSSFQVYDTTSDQVFGGVGARTTKTDSAVSATLGTIRTYGGDAILAQFSSSNGGWSTDGGEPYLVAQKDPYDGAVSNSVHSWSATLPTSVLQKRWPAVGTISSLEITERDGNGAYGGRVLKVVLTGSKGSVTVSGDDIYHAYAWPSYSKGLRSMWWAVSTS